MLATLQWERKKGKVGDEQVCRKTKELSVSFESYLSMRRYSSG